MAGAAGAGAAVAFLADAVDFLAAVFFEAARFLVAAFFADFFAAGLAEEPAAFAAVVLGRRVSRPGVGPLDGGPAELGLGADGVVGLSSEFIKFWS